MRRAFRDLRRRSTPIRRLELTLPSLDVRVDAATLPFAEEVHDAFGVRRDGIGRCAHRRGSLILPVSRRGPTKSGDGLDEHQQQRELREHHRSPHCERNDNSHATASPSVAKIRVAIPSCATPRYTLAIMRPNGPASTTIASAVKFSTTMRPE